jgi:hypothetical protein
MKRIFVGLICGLFFMNISFATNPILIADKIYFNYFIVCNDSIFTLVGIKNIV